VRKRKNGISAPRDMFGWSGTVLKVDLSKETISREPLSEETADTFLGGMGLASKIIWDYLHEKNIRTGFDPLSPDNIFVLAEGPLTGAATQGCKGMYHYISPATGHLGGGASGGFVHASLKQAGYDALVVTGKATGPVYLHIDNDNVEVRDAAHLWGKGVQDTVSQLKKEHGEVSSITIGRAGENLVRHATALSDGFKSGGGKCGTGAVLGSKNLKAIVVRGTKGVRIADPRALKQADTTFRKALKENVGWPMYALWFGYFYTTPLVPSVAHCYDYGVRYEACWNCPMGCCGFHEQQVGPYRTRGLGPEVANQLKFFAECGIQELEPLNYLSDLMNDYGLDWMESPADLGIALKLFKDGIITKKDTGDIELKFGDVKGIEHMIHLMAGREKIGDLIAEGVFNIGRIIPEAKRYDPTVRGTGGFGDPRKNIGPAAMCFFTPYRGACFQHWDWLELYLSLYRWEFPGKEGKRTSRGSTREEVERLVVDIIGKEEAALFTSGDPKGWCALTVRGGNWVNAIESLGLCRRITSIMDQNITLAGVTAQMVSAATGKSFTIEDLELIGERIVNVQRMIDARLGISRKQDKFPKYYYESKDKETPGITEADEKTIEEEMDYYYTLRGWDLETGLPSREKLDQLGLGREAEQLAEDMPYDDWKGPPLPKWNL
jgi:aldehyde:ferredoxin oxidoreductase